MGIQWRNGAGCELCGGRHDYLMWIRGGGNQIVRTELDRFFKRPFWQVIFFKK